MTVSPQRGCSCSCSVVQSCPTLGNPMDCSTPSFPVLHYLLEFAQMHVHWVNDAIQPSSASVALFSFGFQAFPASESFPVSWLFISGGHSTGASNLISVLPMNIQGWFLLGLTGLISLLPRDSQQSSPASKFESINSSVLSLPYDLTLRSVPDYWKNHSFDYTHLCWQSDVSAFQYSI